MTVSTRTRILIGLTAASLGLLGLAGCSTPTTSSDTGSDASDAASAPADSSDDSSADTAGTALAVADSDLGQIVVDGEGKTVYMFDKDTQGAGSSTCSGQCATAWPAVTTDSDSPAVDGVTGEIGTITGTDGSTQVTLNGWPLYYYAADAAAGDTTGQGVGGVWWVLTPAGERVAG